MCFGGVSSGLGPAADELSEVIYEHLFMSSKAEERERNWGQSPPLAPAPRGRAVNSPRKLLRRPSRPGLIGNEPWSSGAKLFQRQRIRQQARAIRNPQRAAFSSGVEASCLVSENGLLLEGAADHTVCSLPAASQAFLRTSLLIVSLNQGNS